MNRPISSSSLFLSPMKSAQSASSSFSPSTPLLSSSRSTAFSVVGTRRRCLKMVTSCAVSVKSTVANDSPPAAAVVE
ncbi:unnamed protein product [Cochlearia groenlandica]